MNHPWRRGLLCLAALLAVGGCGFQPVYMPTASGKPGVAQRELAQIYVALMPDRPGQVLRQALQERLGDDSGMPAAYDLKVAFGIAGEGIGIESDTIATRIRLSGSASWTLTARDEKKTVLASGSARAIDGVNIIDAQYFASDLQVEAEEARMAQNLATQIATRLAAWFRARATQQAQQSG